MKNNYIISLFLYFLSLQAVCAQEQNLPKQGLSLSYFGETFTHSGLQAGLEYYPLQSARHQLVWSINTGFYIHRRNNTSWFVRAQVGQRLISKGGFMLENMLGIGYLRHYANGGEVYRVLPNGAIVESKKSGSGKFMPSVGIGIGYSGFSLNEKPLKFFIRPEIFWKAPFNGYYLTHFALNSGLILPI